jgi:hypothetical protein
MTTRDEGDERLIETLRAAYRPAPLTPAEQARLRAAIAARTAPAAARLRWVPAAVGLAGAIAAIVAAVSMWRPEPAPRVAERTPGAEAWEEDVLLADATRPLTPFDDPETLPDDYRVLSAVLFGGGA